jgi:hypothetical protein
MLVVIAIEKISELQRSDTVPLLWSSGRIYLVIYQHDAPIGAVINRASTL